MNCASTPEGEEKERGDDPLRFLPSSSTAFVLSSGLPFHAHQVSCPINIQHLMFESARTSGRHDEAYGIEQIPLKLESIPSSDESQARYRNALQDTASDGDTRSNAGTTYIITDRTVLNAPGRRDHNGRRHTNHMLVMAGMPPNHLFGARSGNVPAEVWEMPNCTTDDHWPAIGVHPHKGEYSIAVTDVTLNGDFELCIIHDGYIAPVDCVEYRDMCQKHTARSGNVPQTIDGGRLNGVRHLVARQEDGTTYSLAAFRVDEGGVALHKTADEFGIAGEGTWMACRLLDMTEATAPSGRGDTTLTDGSADRSPCPRPPVTMVCTNTGCASHCYFEKSIRQ